MESDESIAGCPVKINLTGQDVLPQPNEKDDETGQA